jgi:cell division protein FtsW
VMVFSASAVVAAERTGQEGYYFIRQFIGVVVGLVLCVAAAFTPTAQIRKYRWWMYGAVVFGLALCFVPGIKHSAGGASRWFGFQGVHIQPSEFAKVTTLICIAHFLERWRGLIRDGRVVLCSLLIAAPIMGMVLSQPDFGTTVIIGGLCGTMLVVAGMQVAHIMMGLVGALCMMVPLMIFEQYRLARWLGYLHPWESMDSDGYHVIQSWIAIHSGGLWGQGLGNSMAKLHFLPEPWTDYIAAIIAEELGLVRLVCMIGLFALFTWRGLLIAKRARDPFGMYLAATLAVMVGLEAFFNMGVVMGMLPPKGLVLPFISYGASAMISHLWAVGLLLSIAAEAKDAPAKAGWPAKDARLQTAPAR